MPVSNETQPGKTVTTGYAPVNGIRMYYEIHGRGAALVLIHGGGSTIETSFGRMLPLLARHYKVIAVELQAHGHSGDRNAPETFEQDADDVAALLQHLSIPKASFLGFSNGGNTAMQMAIRHPGMVEKLIVASGAYQKEGFMAGFFEGFASVTVDSMPEPLKAAFLTINPDPAALKNMFDKDVARMAAFKDWKEEDLRSIKAPTLIINGDKDVVTNEHALKMSRLIPGADLLILPGTHGAYLGEICTVVTAGKWPEITADIIGEFLNK